MTGSSMETSVETAHERAFKLLGGAPGIKRSFGISLQAAHKWAKRVPVDRARKVSELTGVPAAELHPELFGESAGA